MTIVEIYFDDLTSQTQQELLDAFGVQTPEEMNWDIFPVTTIEINK